MSFSFSSVPCGTFHDLPAYALSSETADRLREFEEIARQWNQKINLVSAKDADFLWERHIQDSLRVLPLLPRSEPVIDLGSGGGFPGLVIAIALNLPVTLIESDLRKCAFLREAARLCHAPAKIVPSRFEKAHVGAAKSVTARALAPLPRLLEWAAPFTAQDGACYFFKGSRAAEEIKESSQKWDFHLETFHKKGDEGVILKLTHLCKKEKG